MCPTWEIITALATVAAVLVALGLGVYPILLDGRERRQRARVVGEQVYALMRAINNRWARPFEAKVEGNRMTFEYKDIQLMDSFSAIFPQLILLRPKELEEISNLYSLMKASFVFESMTKEDQEKVMAAVKEVLVKAGRSGKKGGH